MTRGRLVLVVLVVAAAAAAGWVAIARDRAETRTVTAPYFEVDPLWPKPMPNHWMLGSRIGVSVDEQDHVWIIHRPATLADNEKGADLEAAHRGVLLGRAAGARVRRGRERSWATGVVRGRDTNGLHPAMASPWTTRATSGLAATVQATRRC